MQERNVAHRIWLSNLCSGIYVESEGEFEPNYVQLQEERVSRVNVVGTVIDKFTGESATFSSLTIDDGSASMQLRAFKENMRIFNNIGVGDLVLCIAKPRLYQNEIYLVPDVAMKLDNPNWELLRKVELFKAYGKPQASIIRENPQAAIAMPPKNYDGIVKQKALEIITQQGDSGTTIVFLSEQIRKPEDDTVQLIEDLVRMGLIYQDKPGYYKII